MAISWDSFDKIWASTSPLTPYSFSDPNYAQGWNFVGSTPPARQMWDSIQKQNDEKFKYLRDNFGTPNIVTQASQMTDTDKVYVYLGSEAGWNNGHWYYYDEGTSSWADGGVYNSVAFVTDTTLSIAGQPADAKATGDALALKSDLAGCTFTGNVSVNADLSVTGDATIGTDLSVTGVSTLTGNVSAGADVTVVGDVSSANMTTSADATIGGDLSVTGASTLAGNITTSGDISADNISATTNGTVGGNLSVTGTSTLTGNINAGADINAVGDVSADNLTTTTNATVGGSLSVAGTSTLTGNVTTNGNINAVGDISSANLTTTNATIGGNATVTGDVSCANLTTSADASVGGDLTVTGDSTLADTTVNDLVVNNDLSVAGDSSLTNLSVSGTTALAGTSTAPTPSADDNSTKIATTEYVQTELKPIETKATIDDKRISNIEKLLQGNLYDYQADTDSAYTKSVPAGAMPYASLDSIGGKTLVWNQIIYNGNFANGTDGWEKLSNYPVSLSASDGVLSVTVTGSYDAFYQLAVRQTSAHQYQFVSGHKYYVTLEAYSPYDVTLSITNASAFGTAVAIVDSTGVSTWTKGAKILTSQGTSDYRPYFAPSINWQSFQTNDVYKLRNIMFIDLTLLYGAGNEPTTVAEFQQMFPASYYPYNAGTLLSAGVTEVKSVGLNLWDEEWVVVSGNRIANKNPISVLPNTQYTFVASAQPSNGLKFYTLDMVQTGTTRYNTGTFTTPSDCYFITFEMGVSTYGAEYKHDISLNKGTDNVYHPYNGHNYPIPAEIQALEGYGWSAGSVYNYIDYERKVFVQNVGSRAYASGDESDATVITDGTTTYYPLNPAIETDISAYLTDDNLIEVESGGTLTFPNQHGDDYRIDVSSSETYMVDLQEAI